MSVFCSACRTENLATSRFCMSCGAELVAACPSCGSEIVPGARFCPSCGTAIAGGPGDAQETLKLATILFADVVGSTSRAEALHPEDIKELMASYFDAMTEEIRGEGGTVEKFIGDAIMAVFGAPVAHEDDPVRAVRAARRMLARLHDWNLDRADELQMRIGINTGEVLAGNSPGQDLLVTGDTVNVGARLQQEAAAGTILIGLRTARAVRGHFELKEVAPLNLKGKSQAVRAWSVLDERGVIEERGVPGLHAPMVGRDAELNMLVTTLHRVRDEKRPHLITIIGDAGVGKTRLVREFIDSAEPDAKVIAGRCLPYGEGVTLWPLAEILSSEVGLLQNDTSDHAREKILKLVLDSLPPELASEADRTATALALTIGLSRGRPAHDLDPQQAYSELLRSWRVFLSSLASERALIVIIEDIHWADSAMLDVLDDLADHAEGSVLFVCPSRPDLFRSRPDWGGGRRNFSSVPLDPLSSEESALLASFLLEVNALPPEAQARILQRAEGNPFFLEEIVRRLIDEGLVVNEGGRWKATGDIFEADIPDTVVAVILGRLDLLSPVERSVLQRAAVVGRTFWAGAIRDSLEARELNDVIRTLRRRELVEARLTSSMAGEDEFVFKHILIRDVAYESLPRKRRGETHVAVAEWIERTSGDRAEELAEVLAHHYATAFEFLGEDTLRRKARRYYDAAARSAMRRFAISRAETFGRRSVELSTMDERVSALESFGDLSFNAFQSDQAFDTFMAALDELKKSPSPEAETVARLAGKAAILPTRWRGSTDRALESYDALGLIERGLSAAGTVDSKERALLLVARAFMPFARRDEPEAIDESYAREAIGMAERLGDTDLLSAALDAMGGIHMMAGRYGGVLDVARRRIELVSELGVLEACDAFSVASWASFHVGRYEDGIRFATESVERSRGSKPDPYVHGLAWRVAAKFMIGDWDGALDDQAEIERLVEEESSREGPPGYALRAYATKGLCKELRGEVDEADRYLRMIALLDEPAAGGGRGTWIEEHSYAARAYAHRGDLEAARRWLSLDQAMSRAMHMQAACDVYAAARDWDSAREFLPSARAEVTRGELLTLPWALDRLEGQMAAAEDDLDQAILLLRASADGFATLGAVWEDAYSNLLLAETVGKDGRVEPYEGRLASALATFQRLGSVCEIDRATELTDRISS